MATTEQVDTAIVEQQIIPEVIEERRKDGDRVSVTKYVRGKLLGKVGTLAHLFHHLNYNVTHMSFV